MKGYMEEMLYFAAIFFAVFMLFVFLMYQRGTKGAEVKKSVEERLLSEEVASVIATIFNNKLPIVEKTYLEIGIDAILQGISSNRELYKVFYGIGVGNVNVTEVIPYLLENYVKGRWELVIITPDGKHTYGSIDKKKVIYVYEALVPIPEQRVGKVIFLLG
jgi:3-deoxy-D-manno-octulosonic-acid transferase